MNNILLTVITISYNSEAEIGQTIESVINLNYNNVEYVFIDGGSADATVEVINSYDEQLNKRGIKKILLSEKDKGIYDAMNKGLKIASGDSVIFMNAGDIFSPALDLSSLIGNNDLSNNIIIGFSIQHFNGDYYLRPKKSNIQHLINYPAHQAIFVPRKCYKAANFNDDMKIAADYYWIKDVLKLAEHTIVDTVIAIFALGGKSTSKKWSDINLMYKEMGVKFRIAKSALKFFFFNFLGRKAAFRLIYRNNYTRLQDAKDYHD